MAENNEKPTSGNKTGNKVNNFLEKNRKIFIAILIAVIVCLIGFIVAVSMSAKQKEKNIARIDEISFVLTDGSASLEEGELDARRNDALEKLQPLAKKGGIAGARANLLCAELSYQQNDYENALNYWKNAALKSKKSYIAPLAYYQIAVCYEQLNKLEEAAENYKLASDSKEFALVPHAKFSYARVLETLGKIDEAIDVYAQLNDDYPTDDWARLAKTRIILLRTAK